MPQIQIQLLLSNGDLVRTSVGSARQHECLNRRPLRKAWSIEQSPDCRSWQFNTLQPSMISQSAVGRRADICMELPQVSTEGSEWVVARHRRQAKSSTRGLGSQNPSEPADRSGRSARDDRPVRRSGRTSCWLNRRSHKQAGHRGHARGRLGSATCSGYANARLQADMTQDNSRPLVSRRFRPALDGTGHAFSEGCSESRSTPQEALVNAKLSREIITRHAFMIIIAAVAVRELIILAVTVFLASLIIVCVIVSAALSRKKYRRDAAQVLLRAAVDLLCKKSK